MSQPILIDLSCPRCRARRRRVERVLRALTRLEHFELATVLRSALGGGAAWARTCRALDRQGL